MRYIKKGDGMCFSASASFTASGILTLIGFYAVRKAQIKELPLALVPAFFALQQACEGIVWLTYSNPTHATLLKSAIFGYSFFAYIFWPLWVPLSMLFIETDRHRIPLLRLLLILGSAIATFLFFSLQKSSLETTIQCHHIRYEIGLSSFTNALSCTLYCIATIFPCFVSSRKWMPLFGMTTALSVAITSYFYTTFFTSVWCYFAAIISTMIAFIL